MMLRLSVRTTLSWDAIAEKLSGVVHGFVNEGCGLGHDGADGYQ